MALAPSNATSNFTHRSQAGSRRRLGRFGMLILKNEEEGLLHTGCAYFSLLPKAIWVVSDGPISCSYRQEPVMHACGSAAPLCGGCEGRGEWSFRCLENSDERSIALSDLLSPPATSCHLLPHPLACLQTWELHTCCHWIESSRKEASWTCQLAEEIRDFNIRL